MRLNRIRDQEEGFTMAVVMISMLIVTLVLFTAVTAVRGDIHLTQRDLDHKQAFEAAQAGIADYQYHLNADTNYWTLCTSAPTPNALNQDGSTTRRKSVPGSSGATYAIELIPATNKSSCNTSDPSGSFIEQSGTATGTFRIRSTGYSGGVKQSVVATFRRSSFLDYVYFTRLETSDPVTYGYTSSTAIAGANSQCSKTTDEGRYNSSIPGSGGDYCDVIVFVSGETINGPLHSNDTLAICGQPTFGRTSADSIEVSAPPQGWFGSGNCGGSNNPNFVGTFTTNSPELTPPATNGQLSTISGAAKYSGSTRIVLNGNNMTVTPVNGSSTTTSIPSSGVVYVANDPNRACTTSYSPYTVKDQLSQNNDLGCGNVFVSGSYTGKLTIAAENDIIINGNLCRGTSCTGSPNGNGLLGLIANNFVRVNHPFSSQSSKGSCGNGSNSGTTVSRIDAAILSIDHSFIVDHYNCGNSLGTLTVNGAISQAYRGPVGIVGSSTPGYSKNYNYDDRLRFVSPPHFLDPVQTAWHVQRETLDDGA